ncbi:MAG: DUF1638 domain-containing protein [Syntrophobacteraceae bacterium]|nr:DUF1638 domain-containing protein [Syntrophobacteraceae bacterium]
MKKRILIACEIFAREIEAGLPQDADVEILWIEAALHARPERLEEALKAALSAAEAIGNDIRVLLGTGCHPDLCSLTDSYGARLLPAKNCIEAFCGKLSKELEANRTMIMTPGWIRAWPGIMKEMGWNEIDVRINLGRYDKILLLEPGIDPLTEDEILCFFDLVQVPLDIQPLDLSHFKEILNEVLR